jgi:hypothetical protein
VGDGVLDSRSSGAAYDGKGRRQRQCHVRSRKSCAKESPTIYVRNDRSLLTGLISRTERKPTFSIWTGFRYPQPIATKNTRPSPIHQPAHAPIIDTIAEPHRLVKPKELGLNVHGDSRPNTSMARLRKPAAWEQPELLNFRVLGSRVFGAEMSCKVFIAPLLVVPLHFIERVAGGYSRRIEHPRAFGATPAPKTLSFDPYQFAVHTRPSTPHDLLRFCLFERRFGTGPRRHCDDKKPLSSLP